MVNLLVNKNGKIQLKVEVIFLGIKCRFLLICQSKGDPLWHIIVCFGKIVKKNTASIKAVFLSSIT
ncbi:hypothetical protein B0182_12170 [Moraxella bovis]|nr:hypothetical protein B0182_12170 [Moraxella bovis]